MKTKYMLMVAAITIFTINSFAQNLTKQNSTPKERMKMETMKMPVASSNSLIKDNIPGKCPACRSDLNLSMKERMKIEVVKRNTCFIQTNQKGSNAGKCANCGVQIRTANTPHYCNMSAGKAGEILNSGIGLSLSSKEKMKKAVMVKL